MDHGFQFANCFYVYQAGYLRLDKRLVPWNPLVHHGAAYCCSHRIINYMINICIIYILYIYTYIVEGSLEVKLPTIWTVEKQRCETSQKRQDQKKEDADARKDRKVAIHCVFAMICGSGGSKSRLAKAAGAEPTGQMRYEKVHAVVARSTFPSQNGQNTRGADHFWKLRCRKSARRCGAKHILKSKCNYKTHQCRTTFGSCDVEKVHAVVARSTFWSQNVQNTPMSDHFWKFRCRKSARRCGAKHISKSKVLKTDGLGPLLEVQMSKKCRKSAHRCGATHISKSKV